MIIPLCIQAHFVIYSIKSISFFGESSTGAEANNIIITIEGLRDVPGCFQLLVLLYFAGSVLLDGAAQNHRWCL